MAGCRPRAFTLLEMPVVKPFDSPRPSNRETKGFTLVELLVVIAIISILLALLSPTLRDAIVQSQKAECGAGMGRLAWAYNQYATEHNGNLPYADDGSPTSWVQSGNTVEAITTGVIYPYIEELGPYKCTNPAHPEYYRSYSISGYVNGISGGPSKISGIVDPRKTLLMVEEDDNRGYNMGSWLISPPDTWTDRVAGNHKGGDNLTFVDGHIEYWEWIDPDTLNLPQDHHSTDPGSLDLARLAEVNKSLD